MYRSRKFCRVPTSRLWLGLPMEIAPQESRVTKEIVCVSATFCGMGVKSSPGAFREKEKVDPCER